MAGRLLAWAIDLDFVHHFLTFLLAFPVGDIFQRSHSTRPPPPPEPHSPQYARRRGKPSQLYRVSSQTGGKPLLLPQAVRTSLSSSSFSFFFLIIIVGAADQQQQHHQQQQQQHRPGRTRQQQQLQQKQQPQQARAHTRHTTDAHNHRIYLHHTRETEVTSNRRVTHNNKKEGHRTTTTAAGRQRGILGIGLRRYVPPLLSTPLLLQHPQQQAPGNTGQVLVLTDWSG